MTRFDTDLASRGWALISEGAQMISLAYAANEQPGAGVGVPPSSDPAPADDLPPFTDADIERHERETQHGTQPPPLKPQVDAGLGVCPIHGVKWTVKSGGISKNGKPYKSFWKCAEKDGDTFCNEKPQRIWADTHPIREGVAA